MKPFRKAESSNTGTLHPEPCHSRTTADESDDSESDSNEMSDSQNVEQDSRSQDHANGDGAIDTDDDDNEDEDQSGDNMNTDQDSSMSDSDSDSDMSDDEGTDQEDSVTSEALHVSLPDELAELAAGRDEDEGDHDDVVQAILRAREKHRNHPPAIECKGGVAAIAFHAESEYISVGAYTGDATVYKYSDDACELQNTHELHTKAIRDLQFSKDGRRLLSCSKDKSIAMTDIETGKLTNLWDHDHPQAHQSPVHTLFILDENRFCSGCEEGYVKMWDTRQRDAVFSLRVMEDIVNQIISTPQNKHIAVACGGTITSINVNARKVQVQSEEYEHDFTCLGLFRHDSKLLAGSSKGTMYLFNWGEFGLHSDEFTGFKQPVSCLIPVTETVAITGWEDGKLRATHLFPHQPLGVVGQHDFSVECLDVSHDGALIASAAAAGEYVKFWNIKYIEEIEVKCTKKKKKKTELNLPSSEIRNAGDFFAGLSGP